MGFVNQDVELAPRNGNKEIYATTTAPTRLESYKVNPMFNDTKGSDQYDMQEKNETNGREVSYTL